jgi:hypothetical protein
MATAVGDRGVGVCGTFPASAALSCLLARGLETGEDSVSAGRLAVMLG